MRAALAIFLVAHGLIHLIGAARGLRLAAVPQLTQPISPVQGGVWLAAALLLTAAAGALYLWPRWWWLIALAGAAVSFAAIVPSWADAKFGALANAVVLAAVVFGCLADGPSSLGAEYEDDRALRVIRSGPGAAITDLDLAGLPDPVARYLRVTGVVGQPRVRTMQARMRGRIRSGPEAPWMPFTAEQFSVFEQDPARLFYMDARRMFLPIQGLHRYTGREASMRIKAAGLVSIVNASGPEMTQAETVTMFNDMCVLAPATLIDRAIRWEGVEDQVVTASYSNAGHTIRARLVFAGTGELVDFWSDDRRQASADGRTFEPRRWSTPVGRYRAFGPVRLASAGEGRWHEPAGPYAYVEIEMLDITYNAER